MISAKRATTIVFERDRESRERMVDKLTEQDATYVLKMLLREFNHEMPEGWPGNEKSQKEV